MISALVFVVGLAYFMVASWGSALVLKTYLLPGVDNDLVAVVLDKSNRLAKTNAQLTIDLSQQISQSLRLYALTRLLFPIWLIISASCTKIT